MQDPAHHVRLSEVPYLPASFVSGIAPEDMYRGAKPESTLYNLTSLRKAE
jgi:hypothetical protein